MEYDTAEAEDLIFSHQGLETIFPGGLVDKEAMQDLNGMEFKSFKEVLALMHRLEPPGRLDAM